MKVQAKKTVTRSPKAKVLKPTLTLTPDVAEVKANGSCAVAVDMKGLDTVELTLEPRGAFTIDLKSLTKSGVVRMKGKKDGTATLIASGRVGAGEVIRTMVHVRCDGPVVRILGFGYWPAK